MKDKQLSQVDLADILYPSIEEDLSESIVDLAPEKRRLHTESMDYTVSSLVERFAKGDIYIPNFQRGYEWKLPQASRLIESLIIQCPIPVIYMSQDSDERLAVVDGNQRINAIDRYLKDKFSLTGLTVYPELSGKKFSELDPRFQRHIQARVLRCLTILKDTHPQIKFDVFERLNTGSLKLSPQELRHGVYFGDMIQVCNEISTELDDEVMGFLGKTTRMKAEELVLRYFAFSSSQSRYAKPLSSFLNTFAEENKRLSAVERQQLKDRYLEVLRNALRLFGGHVFKASINDGRAPFNAAVYDTQMYISEKVGSAMTVEEASKRLKILFKDPAFVDAITRATSDDGNVRSRFSIATRVFELS